MPCTHHMRYEHFVLFNHGIVRAQSECPALRQEGSYVGVCQPLQARLLAVVCEGYMILIHGSCTSYNGTDVAY